MESNEGDVENKSLSSNQKPKSIKKVTRIMSLQSRYEDLNSDGILLLRSTLKKFSQQEYKNINLREIVKEAREIARQSTIREIVLKQLQNEEREAELESESSSD